MLSPTAVALRTLLRLGVANGAAVALYRARVKVGLYSATPALVSRLLFRSIVRAQSAPASASDLLAEAGELAAGRLRAFGGQAVTVGNPPNWHRSVFSGETLCSDIPWWRISVGNDDIKGVWEASRFDWLLVLARAASVGRDYRALDLANAWCLDWITHNPSGFGPNWQCGQETAIRLMQALLVARILGQDQEPEPGLRAFARAHLARIVQTRTYANAQDNNHSTSEAFALFAGGAWLFAVVQENDAARDAVAWSHLGRRWLERGVARLIFEDGGFSQYSVNYHRLMLQTLCHAELWRRWLRLEPFSSHFYARAQGATRWLAAIVNAENGDAPNLGSNDGARPFRLDSLPYRDHRPSVQLAAAVFLGSAAYPPGPWDEPLHWCGLASPLHDFALSRKHSRWFADFGLALLNPRVDGSGAYAFVRVPQDRFRPSHADPLHFDLWTAEGDNLLRDAGSASYADSEAVDYFTSIKAHNTIAFDNREPMPRLSRFLFGDWIRGEATKPCRMGATLKWSGSYRDRLGAGHRRSVTASGDEWLIEDEVCGFSCHAILHWRFAPGPTEVHGAVVETDRLVARVEGDVPPIRTRLVNVPESRTYGQTSQSSALEVVFPMAARRIRTHIRVK